MAAVDLGLDPVHTNPPRYTKTASPKTELFVNGLQGGEIWKRRLGSVVYTAENGAFRRRWR